MIRHWRVIITLTIALALPSICPAQGSGPNDPQGPGNPHGSDEWTVPDCIRITGTNAFTFTTDEGLTMAETSFLRGNVYSHGLTTLDDIANNLLAASMTNAGTSILRSEDAGCSWHEIEMLPVSELLLLTAGPGGTAYAWSRGRTAFYRIDGEQVTTLTAPNKIYGMAVDSEDAAHIRFGSMDCQLWESFNGGVSFQVLGEPANTGNGLFFTMEFDPNNWDHALCGSFGAWQTTDAGQSWNTVTGLEKEDGDWVYLFVFAPTDPNRVWARANLDITGEYNRCILASNDGGASFEIAVEQLDEAIDQNGDVRGVVLTNQPAMAAHPDLPDVLYFVFGSYYQGIGTNIFRYNYDGDQLSVVHIDDLDGIDAIAFNPIDASVMYLGLEEENVSKLQTVSSSDADNKLTMTAVPNPFNPDTEIRFSLPEAGQVKLDIYNVIGQKVTTLVDGYLNAGEHTYRWDGSGVASGVYLYRLDTGVESMTKKMILLK